MSIHRMHSKEKEPVSLKKHSRQGKGTHGLPIVRELLKDKENWRTITCKDDCNFVAPMNRHKPCDKHPDKPLQKTNTSESACPVKFAYIFPKKFEEDNRRWTFGYALQQKDQRKNLHNHPIAWPAKMRCMMKKLVQGSAAANPQLKPNQMAKGIGLPCIPGSVDEASNHIGRLAREVKKGRQKASCGSDWDIAAIADTLDTNDTTLAAKSDVDISKLKKISRPYLVSTGLESRIRYISTMNPLMLRILSKSEFVEADVTFNETREFPYLFNMVAFGDVTMEWAVVSRVRLDKEGAKAHALAFRKT